MPESDDIRHTPYDAGRRVRTQHDVGKNLIVVHLNVADGDTQAENLLELELDRGANLGDLVREVLRVRDGGRELAGCGGVGGVSEGR